jgi:hypothetical protein
MGSLILEKNKSFQLSCACRSEIILGAIFAGSSSGLLFNLETACANVSFVHCFDVRSKLMNALLV